MPLSSLSNDRYVPGHYIFKGSGDQTPIGHDSDCKKTIKTDRSVIVQRIKRSNSSDKSSDKSTKYRDSSAMNGMEAHFYEKLSDIKTDGPTHESDNYVPERERSVPLEEEIKNLNPTTKSSYFPSLPDVILRKLQLLRESCCSLESLSEQEVESKFATLSLSFKTDKLTLGQRVSLHRHQRDVSEQDANNEIQSLRDYIQSLNKLIFSCDDLILTNMRSEIKELFHKLETQVEVIGQTNAKISSRSELFGAVKQEERVSSAFDVVLLHSENLKRAKDKERKELEKTKKLLNSKKTDLESDSETESVPLRRSIRSISTTVIPKMNLIRVRRASVSSFEILPNSEVSTHRKSVQHNIGVKQVTTSPSYLLNRSRRCSMPVTPVIYRARNGTDNEYSHLEITTEERCGSEESDCASSVANQESDEEQSPQSKLHLRLSEEVDNSSSSSEKNNNITNAINNNNNNTNVETISQRFSHENSDRSADNSSDENIKNSDRSNEEKQRRIQINFIEINYFINLFNLCFEGRVGSYVKRLAQEMRLIFAIILLISAILIVVWSLLPTSFPCECRCTMSWLDFVHKFANSYHLKGNVSPSL